MDRIQELESKVNQLLEVMFVMYLQMDMFQQMRIEKMYPKFEEMKKKLQQ